MKLYFENVFSGDPSELKYNHDVVMSDDENAAYREALVDEFEKDIKTLLDLVTEFDEKWETVDGIRAYCAILSEPYQGDFMRVLYQFMDTLKENLSFEDRYDLENKNR